MCTQIEVRADDRAAWKWPETVGELRAIVGNEGVVGEVYPEAPEGFGLTDEECLCHVNIQATAEKAGYTCRSGWQDAGLDFIWEPHALNNRT